MTGLRIASIGASVLKFTILMSSTYVSFPFEVPLVELSHVDIKSGTNPKSLQRLIN